MDDRLNYLQLEQVREEVERVRERIEPLIERQVDDLRRKLDRERDERISKIWFGISIAFMLAAYTFFIVVIAASNKGG